MDPTRTTTLTKKIERMTVLRQEAKHSAEAHEWKFTAASTPQVWFVVSSSTSFGVNLYFDTIVTDYGVWWIEFLLL